MTDLDGQEHDLRPNVLSCPECGARRKDGDFDPEGVCECVKGHQFWDTNSPEWQIIRRLQRAERERNEARAALAASEARAERHLERAEKLQIKLGQLLAAREEGDYAAREEPAGMWGDHMLSVQSECVEQRRRAIRAETQLRECEEALRSAEAEFAAFREHMLAPIKGAEGKSIESLSWDELLAVAVRNLNAAQDAERELAVREELSDV